jgi:hypothetical protein
MPDRAVPERWPMVAVGPGMIRIVTVRGIPTIVGVLEAKVEMERIRVEVGIPVRIVIGIVGIISPVIAVRMRPEVKEPGRDDGVANLGLADLPGPPSPDLPHYREIATTTIDRWIKVTGMIHQEPALGAIGLDGDIPPPQRLLHDH